MNISKTITLSPQSEFWFHVAKQDEIPIAGDVDKSINNSYLHKIAKNTPDDRGKASIYIAEILKSNPDVLDVLRVLVGVSDKRLYLDLSYEFAKTPGSEEGCNVLGQKFTQLNKHPVSYFKRMLADKSTTDIASKIISEYLIDKEVVSVLRAFGSLSESQIEVLIDKLVITKEVQQAEAKRRGHGAEYHLAVLLHNLGCDLVPSDRYKYQIGGKDPNVSREELEVIKKNRGKTWSFDLIIKKQSENLIFIQSLVHTSDPGQYGVNKSDETVQIKQDINNYNKDHNSDKELWGLVDGVGFCENKKDTIDKMLNEFDCFIQMKTLYKAGLRLHKLGLINVKAIKFDTSFYSRAEYEEMFLKYGSKNIQLLNDGDTVPKNAISAGYATLVI